MVKPFWRSRIEDDASGNFDGLVWHKDLGNHHYGEFSMAVVQANNLLEDQSHLETLLALAILVLMGLLLEYMMDTLELRLQALVSEHHEISENVIKKAFSATEEDFLCLVKKEWLRRPQIAAVGSCCLVGVVCNEQLYIANAGDSRVVLGRAKTGRRRVEAMQLSKEHNANIESVRNELQSLHPDDSQIVVLKHKVWRVKGIIQVSRSIGDAYLKRTEFNKEPLPTKYRLAEPFHKPILSSEPSILVHKLQPEDQFLIFASDGLWEHLSNEEAVKTVQNFPRDGIAKRLVKDALKKATKKREMRFSDLKKINPGVRRHFHDDITVVVVFIDSRMINRSSFSSYPSSIRGGGVPIPTELWSFGYTKMCWFS